MEQSHFVRGDLRMAMEPRGVQSVLNEILRQVFVWRTSVIGVYLAMACSLSAGQESQATANSALSGKELFEKTWTSKPADDSAEEGVKSKGAQHAVGHDPNHASSDFRSAFDPPARTSDGLGPFYNATSCSDCHPNGGGGGITKNVMALTIDPRSPAVRSPKFGGSSLQKLFPTLLTQTGDLNFQVVVHNHSTLPTFEETRQKLFEHIEGEVSQGWMRPKERTVDELARRPVLAGRYQSIDYYLSQRNPPALYGSGQLARINPGALGAIAQRQTRDSEGKISGRLPPGLLGWRGNRGFQDSILASCEIELGLTALDNFDKITRSVRLQLRRGGVEPDLTAAEMSELSAYVFGLPAPVERIEPGRERDALEGEGHFYRIGCGDCHVPDIPPAMNVFSDLLLHDMGPDLQAPFPAPMGIPKVSQLELAPFQVDNPVSSSLHQTTYGNGAGLPRPLNVPLPATPRFPVVQDVGDQVSWDSLQREWRTPPLWGVADSAPYLHDGRAATLEEAILWHGGEATDAQTKYETLPQAAKEQILVFLSTLRAPPE